MPNPKITGFQEATTYKYEGWTDKIISDFEIILTKMRNDPKIQQAISFRDLVREHIFNSPDAHDLDISPWLPTLLGRLFTAYRNVGYTGTMNEMLLAIVKDIPVATSKDVEAGFSTRLAMNVPGWKQMFAQHAKQHPFWRTIFQPGQIPPCQASIQFGSLFPKLYQPYEKDGYPLTAWNSREGTMAFELLWRFPESEEQYTDTVVTLDIPNGSLTFPYKYDRINGFELRCILTIGKEERDTIVASLPSFNGIGFLPVVLAYNQEETIIDTPVGVVHLSDVEINKAYKLKVGVDFRQGLGIHLNYWYYYPQYCSSDERLFFLN